MQHTGTQTLETPRLLLRRFSVGDAQAMYQNWASDPAVTQFLVWPLHKDIEETRAILTCWVAEYADPARYNWAIVWKAGGEPIGSISVVEQDDRLALAHIGYCIGQSYWNRGITSEALTAVIRYLFEQAGFNRIESRHDPENPHSGMVMRHCGMRREGTVRQADRSNRGVCDYVLYGMLKSDYDAAKAAGSGMPGAVLSGTDGGAADANDFRPGRYRHFKGREYELLACATHSETREPLVVYRALYGEYGVWVRPANMWNEWVERDGRRAKRFTYLGPMDADGAES